MSSPPSGSSSISASSLANQANLTAKTANHANYFDSKFLLSMANEMADTIQQKIQIFYDWYISLFGSSLFVVDIVGSLVLTIGFFWFLGSLYTILDLLQKPHFLYKYKVQDKKVTWNDVIKTAKVSLTNQLTVQLVTSIGFYLLTQIRPLDSSPKVPPLNIIIYHIAIFSIIQEISFYYFHRLLHHGLFYRYIHKVHHHWQAPIAISALYCHPFEHFLANLVPVLLGPFIMSSHRVIIALWLILVHIITLNDHSGYHFPLMPSPEYHDYHHLTFNQNFGRMGVLDYLHGTNERYLKSKHSKRHQVLLSLTPIKVLVPNDDD